MKFYLLIIIVFISFVLPNQTSTDIQKQIDSINKEIKNIDKEIEQINSQIDNNEISLNGLELEIKKLRNEIKIIELEIKQNDTKIAELENEIKEKEIEKRVIENEIDEKNESINTQKNEIENKKLTIEKRKEELAQRLIHIYKYNNDSIIKELLSADLNFNLDLLYYLPILVKADEKLRDDLKNEIETLNTLNESLEIDIRTLNNKKSYLNGTITIIKEKLKTKQNLKKKKNNYYASLETKKEKKTNKIEQKKKEINKLKEKSEDKKNEKIKYESKIKTLFSDKSKALERERKLNIERNKQNKPTTGQFAKMKGKLNWPLKNDREIINKFGVQKSEQIKIPNDGIDIKTNEGSLVYPVLDGIVAEITYLGPQYGEVIVIDHGDNNYTVYSNIKEIEVIVNDYVDKDISIAKVANNSTNTNFLHFEIYHNEKTVNPEIWLNKTK